MYNPFLKDICKYCGLLKNEFGECECDEKAEEIKQESATENVGL